MAYVFQELSYFHTQYLNKSKLINGGFPAKSPFFYSLDIGLVHVIGLASYSEFVEYSHQVGLFGPLNSRSCAINTVDLSLYAHISTSCYVNVSVLLPSR